MKNPNENPLENNPRDRDAPAREAIATQQPGFFRCLFGSGVAGALASAAYALTRSIATTFANKPIVTDKALTANIASAVRTLVVGGSTLATFVFAFAALGLFALAVQELVRQFRQPKGLQE